MTEAELVFHKKNKKKNKKQLLEAVLEPGNPPETTTTEVDSHKKHKHKKKKTKSEKDDCRPVEGQGDTRERQNKKKRKHDEENVSVTQEAADAAAAAAQEREVKKKKKKKRRIEEPDRPGENPEAEAALTAVQTNLEPVPQKRVKRKAKVRKTHTQPAVDTHSPTDARLNPDDVPEAPVLDVDYAIWQDILVFHKKKKNKNKKQLLEAVAEPGKPPETTTTGVDSHKKHKHKKKKTKSEKDDCRPVDGQCDTRERQNKKKRKHDAENVCVTQEAAAAAAAQEREVKKKKKKKRRIEEPDRPGENSEAEAALTAVQTNLEPVPQKRVKRKAKVRKTHTQPAVDTHSPTDARLHPDDVPKAPVLDVDDAIRQEILEFLPNFTFCHVVMVQGAIKYDLPRFRVYKKQGIPLRTGRFTAAENKQLKQNVKDFLAVSGIDSEFKLFRPTRFPDETVTIRRLKRKFNFLRCLCAGIPRSWDPILHRARRFCNRENYKGRFTEDENKDLKKLYTLHGSNWTTISDKMGRSCSAVKNRFCMMSEAHGAWSEAELKVLLTCLHQQLLKRAEPGGEGDDGSAVIQKMDLYKKLPWNRLAKQVQTRSFLQCKSKWMTYLVGKMKTGGKIHGRKNIEGQIQLIKAINEMVVEESGDIVWDDLTHLFGNTPPVYLQMKFHQLKMTYIPDWNRKSFCDIIDFLYEKTLPKLEEDLKGCKDDDDEPAELRQSYKLSEIFPNL